MCRSSVSKIKGWIDKNEKYGRDVNNYMEMAPKVYIYRWEIVTRQHVCNRRVKMAHKLPWVHPNTPFLNQILKYK